MKEQLNLLLAASLLIGGCNRISNDIPTFPTVPTPKIEITRTLPAPITPGMGVVVIYAAIKVDKTHGGWTDDGREAFHTQMSVATKIEDDFGNIR